MKARIFYNVNFSIARSLADLARGFSRDSAADVSSGFLVSRMAFGLDPESSSG